MSRSVRESPVRLPQLEGCFAIQLERVPGATTRWQQGSDYESQDAEEGTSSGSDTPTTSNPKDAWLHESGYILFQNFQEANRQCYWQPSVVTGVNALQFRGYVAPGMVLVSASTRHLEALRGAWCRKILQPPPGYALLMIGEVETFTVQPIVQGQFTPLSDALCWVVWELRTRGSSAHLNSICRQLLQTFPDIVKPSQHLVYTTLGKLIKDRKIYHGKDGYSIVTPETYERTSVVSPTERPILLTNEEALDIVAEIQGDAEPELWKDNTTSREIQVDLADLICGGEPVDNTLRPSLVVTSETSSSLRRQGSVRMLSHKRSLTLGGGAPLSRAESLRLAPSSKRTPPVDKPDLSHMKRDLTKEIMEDKGSVWSRLFRRNRPKLVSISGQFPPPEFSQNRKSIFHSVGTQTKLCKARQSPGLSPRMHSSLSYRGSSAVNHTLLRDHLTSRGRSASLPRRLSSRSKQRQIKRQSDTFTPQQLSTSLDDSNPSSEVSPNNTRIQSPVEIPEGKTEVCTESELKRTLNRSSCERKVSKGSLNDTPDNERSPKKRSDKSARSSPYRDNQESEAKSPRRKSIGAKGGSPAKACVCEGSETKPTYSRNRSVDSILRNSVTESKEVEPKSPKRKSSLPRAEASPKSVVLETSFEPLSPKHRNKDPTRSSKRNSLPRSNEETAKHKNEITPKQPQELPDSDYKTKKIIQETKNLQECLKKAPNIKFIDDDDYQMKEEKKLVSKIIDGVNVNSDRNSHIEFSQRDSFIKKHKEANRNSKTISPKHTTKNSDIQDNQIKDVNKQNDIIPDSPKKGNLNSPRRTHSFSNKDNKESGRKFQRPSSLNCDQQDLDIQKLKKKERELMNNVRVITSPAKPENLSYVNVFKDDANQQNLQKSVDKIPFSVTSANAEKMQSPDKICVTNGDIHAEVILAPAEKISVNAQNSPESTQTLTPDSTSPEKSLKSYLSLSDLNLNFKSITGQKILNGMSVTSIDTLVEVNMIEEEKPEVKEAPPKKAVTHTHFGYV